ncbi:MAG: hypothetical protein ACETWQ_04775, partial [Phycisphaerae bacterium]
SISLLPAIQATGSLASAPERLTPSEHASLSWSHYLIRLHIKNYQKNLYSLKKLTFIRTQYKQNQRSWRQNRVKVSPENQGVF